MGKFVSPRITTADRMTITPDKGEVMYDTDLNSYWGGDGVTVGGIPIGTGGSTGWTDVAVTDTNFTAVNDTRYYLAAGVLSANRTVNMSGVTTQVAFVVAEDYDRFHLTMTGATVYDSGGSNVTTAVLGQWCMVISKIGSKLIRTQ